MGLFIVKNVNPAEVSVAGLFFVIPVKRGILSCFEISPLRPSGRPPKVDPPQAENNIE